MRKMLFITIAGLFAAGCTSTDELTQKWMQKVDTGEYGYVNFKKKEYRNIDIPPEPLSGFDTKRMSITEPVKCLARLVNKGEKVNIVLQFLIEKDGTTRDHRELSGEIQGCEYDALKIVEEARFRPAFKNGKPIPVVALFTITFQYKWFEYDKGEKVKQ